MATFAKPSDLNTVWASEAISADIEKPSDSYIKKGWEQVKPPYEYENWIQNQQSAFIAYLNQYGFVGWDSETQYIKNQSIVRASNGLLYKCIQTHTNKNPASGNTSYWEVFEGNRQATTAARGTVELATTSEVASGTSTTRAVTPSGLRGILEVIFPVGSILMRPTDPSKSIAQGGVGFGTWVKVEGRTLIGEGNWSDSRGQNKTFSANSSGGAYSHKMSTSEMPRHRHNGNTDTDTHSHGTGWDSGAEGDDPWDMLTAGNSGRKDGVFTQRTKSDSHNHGFNTSYEGSGNAFNITQPYYVVAIWQRTS